MRIAIHRSFIILLLLLFGKSVSFAQQLVLNEFSQGSSGTKEYMELVVTGTKTCTDSCMDIRNWIFDDHNGWYGASTGMGIATGCMRFANNANWACVPYGSIIVLYNNIDKNTSITLPDDPTDANNDNVYIVPVNDPLIEKNSSSPVSPSSLTYVYPSTGFSTGGNWTTIGMANTGDAVIITSASSPGTAHFSMTYGNVNGGTIHINASGAGDVYYLSNQQYSNVSSWLIGSAGVNETPGAPNTVANAAWINGMKNASGGNTSTNLNISICQGETYNFNGTLYNTSGTYIDTLQTSNGCDSIVQLDLTVKPAPTHPVITSNSPICAGMQLHLSATSGIGVTYAWNGPVNFSSGIQNPVINNIQPSQAGYYKVIVSLNGCNAADSVNVIVHNAPVTAVNNDTFICPHISVPLSASGGAHYIWSPSAGLSCTNCANPIATPAITTTYAVIITDTNNCTANEDVKITVDDIHASFTVNKDTLCGPEDLILTNTSTGTIVSRIWSFGDAQTATSIDATHHYDNPGNYIVSLILTSDSTCKDTATRPIAILPFPSVDFTLSDSVLCEGSAALIQGNFSAGASSITWDFGDGFNGFNEVNPQHAYDTSGSFAVAVRLTYPHCPDQFANHVAVIRSFPRVDIGPDTSICPNGEAINIIDKYATKGRTYQWNTGDTTPSVLIRHHGLYTVNVTDAGGCSTNDSVEVFKSCYIDIPNAFTPNGDGNNDYFLPRQLLSKQLTRFNMQVYNRWGQIIFETNSINGRGWDGKFNGSDQPQGVYVYMIDAEIEGRWPEKYQGNVTLLR